ncbi:hypothetical protein TSMG0132 [Halocynthia phage JM-2012]|uniref:DNA polymerase n=1 Tax=Halocynthia phage JM-2012 TaxID=1173297 RepID=UPI00025C6960|nr:DNA polymerase [Halocynthia phage JM-2012]AFI55415.1 hypothetical protein TSMG0132 [Halocynthia phage JM-2012]
MSFTFPLEEYERDFSITDTYTRQLAIGLSRLRNCSVEEATKFMQDILDANKERIDGTTIEFTMRQKNGDRVVKQVPILDYLKKINDSSLGMSPTLTTYKRPDQELSLIVEDIAGNMAKRKVVKREAQLAKQAGDSVVTTIKNGGQNAIKVLINSWSGAALDKHNVFNCQSTHPTLTSMCRISTALATASVEKFLGGKRYYHKPEKVIEDILAVVDRIDVAKVLVTVNKYKLVIPTVEQAMNVIKRSTDYYWWDAKQFSFIEELIRTLSPEERTAFVYDGDFYHLFEFNHDFTHNMLTELSNTLFEDDVERERFKEMDDDITTLVSNLIGNDIKGSALWDYLDPEKHPEDNPIRKKANQIANNLLEGLGKYKLLITTFFRVSHYPIDVGAQNHSIRVTVPLGDTDSTIFTTKHINAKYYGEAKFDEEQEPVSDVMVYMVNGVIAHALGNFSAQMGVMPDRRKLLIMKNEYKFPSAMLTPVAKTYHAYVKAQEGLVFDKPEFELKGARFHAGANNMDLVKELHDLMERNLTNLNKGIKINRGELIDIMLRVENDIKASLDRKDNLYFKRVKVKDGSEYKNPNSSVYAHCTLWNALFGNSHGKAKPDPQYMAYKVDLIYNDGGKEFMSRLSKSQLANFETWKRTHDKKADMIPNAILVPVDSLLKFGIPDVLKDYADIGKIASFSLDPHRLNLQAMGILTDKADTGTLISDILEQ